MKPGVFCDPKPGNQEGKWDIPRKTEKKQAAEEERGNMGNTFNNKDQTKEVSGNDSHSHNLG